jgi:hypothetical protein
MAKQKGNVVTHGLSGKIGDLLVFSRRGGQTVVSKVAERTAPPSEKQKEQRKRFQQAVIYAKAATASPEDKAVYESAKTGKTPFNAAVADFLNAPDINGIDLSGYRGQAGDVIKVWASDDFAVKSVKVSIINDDGSLVEEGDALPDVSRQVWTYTATQNNDNLDGDKIVVSASDLPGNITVSEQLISEQ